MPSESNLTYFKHGFKNGGVLSMGMSDIYRVAIEEGATVVRVGRMILMPKDVLTDCKVCAKIKTSKNTAAFAKK